jgi:hypothetical protein
VRNVKLEIAASVIGFIGMLTVSVYFLIIGLYSSGAEKIYQLVLSSVCFVITATLFVNIIRVARYERKRKIYKKYLGTRSYDFDE